MDEKINFIRHYQNSIEKSQNDDPERVLHCLKKLQSLKINVHDLQETGIGKTVNLLRKLDGEAGELATKLVTKWKDQISKMNDSEPLPETPPPQREKYQQNDSKKHHSKSSSAEYSDSNKKSSKSHSSSTSNHHHSKSSNNHHSSHHSEHKKDKEKEHKKSNEIKSSEHKHHSSKSHHTSSASSHKTSSSHKRSREDAESKENETNAKKLKSDTKTSKGSSEKKASSSSSNGTSNKSSKKDDHKSSTSSSKKRKHPSEEPAQEEFDGAQGIGFAEALASFDMPSSSKHKKHNRHDQLADKIISVKTSSNSHSSSSKTNSSSKTHYKKEKDKETLSKASSSIPSTSKSVHHMTQPPKLLTQKPKLDLLSDIANELPNDVSIPDYRPLPLNSAIKDYILGSSSSQSRHSKMMSDGDLLTESISSKANRTRVFSGNSKIRSQIPRLFDMCIRILQENIDYLECTGGVPFEILRPVLERAKPEQLAAIEYYNPYLLDDSDILWKPHSQRKWKCKQPLEMETWREMYERCSREEDEKLSRLTHNIRQHQAITSNGIQKTKMAFVDTAVKAPRGMARRQEQFGTDRKLVASPAARTEGLRNIAPNIAAPGDVRLRVAAGLRDDAQQVVGRGGMQRNNLAKKAPMMAKILSKFKR